MGADLKTPRQKQDPWSAYKSAQGNPAPKQPAGPSRLEALESTLKQSAQSTAEQQIASAVQSHAARVEKQAEARFQRLEANMEELRAQNMKLGEW